MEEIQSVNTAGNLVVPFLNDSGRHFPGPALLLLDKLRFGLRYRDRVGGHGADGTDSSRRGGRL